VKKGKDAQPHELSSLRAVLAGDLPCSEGRAGSRKEKAKERTATRRAVKAIRSMQEAAAQMQEAWYKEAKGEIAQRNEEEAMRRWVGPAAGAWIHAPQIWELNAAGRRVVRRDEQEEAEEEGAEGHVAQGAAEAATPKRGEQVGAGLRYAAKGKKKRSGVGTQGGQQGWSIARAVAEYKRWEWGGKGYSDTNKERWQQVAEERTKAEERQKEVERQKEEDREVDAESETTRKERDKERAQGEGGTERSDAHNKGKRTREEQHEEGNGEEHARRQRGASKQSEQGGEGNEPYSEQSGTAQQRDQQHTAEAESAEQTCKEQRGVEPTQDEGEGAYRTQQRDEEEEQSGSSKRKRGKQKMDPHQQSQWDERQKAATAPASSDEEDGAMQQSRKQQREYGEDHDRQPRSHGEARTSPTAPATN
jgi:hypothetical protein